jgi:hypothetical protein
MFQTINGVQIKEHEENKENPNTLEKRFEIEYLDNVYLNKLVCIDIINIPVKVNVKKYGIKRQVDYGRKWMYVVKHNDFELNRKRYAEVCSLIHDKIGIYLRDGFGIDPTGMFIIDNMDKVYVLSKN